MNANELAAIVKGETEADYDVRCEAAETLASLVQSGQLVGWVPIAESSLHSSMLIQSSSGYDLRVARWDDAMGQWLTNKVKGEHREWMPTAELASRFTHVMSIPESPREGG